MISSDQQIGGANADGEDVMTAMRAAWIVCDENGCESQIPEDLSSRTIGDVERDARRDGWRRLPDGTHRCPNHCPTCGATGSSENCSTASGRDHASRRRQMIEHSTGTPSEMGWQL